MFGSEDRIIIKDIPNLDSVRAVCNKVVVRINHEVTKTTSTGGLIMCADSDWDEAGNCNVHGTVVKVPTKLFRREKPKYEFGIEHGTVIEIIEGDEVWFTRTESFNCPAFIIEDDLYYVIDYPELILAERDGEKILLNGNILMKRVYEKPASEYMDLSLMEEENRYRGEVIAVGRPNDWYLTKNVVEPKNIEKGDIVIAKMPTINIENQYYSILEDCTYMQRRWLSAVL